MTGLDCFADRVALKRHVGYLPDTPFFYDYLTGWELLRFIAAVTALEIAGSALSCTQGLARHRREARTAQELELARRNLTAEGPGGDPVVYVLNTLRADNLRHSRCRTSDRHC
jgi:hypothetical protein